MLAASGLTVLWRARGASRARATAVALLGVLAVVEVAPSLALEWRSRLASIELVTSVREGVIAEADQLIKSDETIFILPAGNDFLANSMVPMIGARSYNVGIDKNFALASTRWPSSIAYAYLNYDEHDAADYLCTALATDVDAIVLTYVSPSSALLLAGDTAEDRAAREARAREFARDPRFDAEIGGWMTVLRGADPECRPSATS